MDLANVIALISLLVVITGMIIAGWINLSAKNDATNAATSEKIARLYQRLDENKEQFYKAFVEKEVHAQSLIYTQNMYQQKHDGLNDLVKEKLDNLAQKIEDQSRQIESLSRVINTQNNGGKNG